MADLMSKLISLLRGLVAAGILIHELVAYIGAPLWRYLAHIRLFERFLRWVETLPRWGVLALAVAPLAIAEPLKIGGLYLLATGHALSGIALLVIGYAVSLVLAERILHAGHGQLMTYHWFAVGWRWFERFRGYILSRPVVVAMRRKVTELTASARELRETVLRRLRQFAGI